MSQIKLYVILSILVFNLLEEACARGGGGKSTGRRNKLCRGGGGGGGPSGSTDCKYCFLKKYIDIFRHVVLQTDIFQKILYAYLANINALKTS